MFVGSSTRAELYVAVWLQDRFTDTQLHRQTRDTRGVLGCLSIVSKKSGVEDVMLKLRMVTERSPVYHSGLDGFR
jgi:hypothetical protein